MQPQICTASPRTRDEGCLSWNQSVYNGSCKVGPSSNTGPGDGPCHPESEKKLEDDLLTPNMCVEAEVEQKMSS